METTITVMTGNEIANEILLEVIKEANIKVIRDGFDNGPDVELEGEVEFYRDWEKTIATRISEMLLDGMDFEEVENVLSEINNFERFNLLEVEIENENYYYAGQIRPLIEGGKR